MIVGATFFEPEAVNVSLVFSRRSVSAPTTSQLNTLVPPLLIVVGLAVNVDILGGTGVGVGDGVGDGAGDGSGVGAGGDMGGGVGDGAGGGGVAVLHSPVYCTFTPD